MAYNGTGTFKRDYNWTTDAANGVNIEAVRMDGEDDGFATGLSNAITKDGQTTITANIPFNSKKITGLANGSARTDSIALGQVQDGTYKTLGTLGGSADTYTATPTPAITAYATGSEFNLKVNADNTGASTLNVSAVAAKNIKKYDGAGSKIDLEAGDLQQDQYYKVIYDGTDFILLNPEIVDNLKSNNLTSNNLTSNNLIINNKLNTLLNSATISSGAITYAGHYTSISGEGGSADTLTTINGGVQGDKILLDQAGQVITIEDGSGNIQLPLNQNIVLVDGASCVELIFDGSNWVSTCSTSTREQDGIYAGGASTPTIVFPVAFTTAVTSIVVTPIGAAAINGLMATIISGSVSTTSFQCEINRHDANPETSPFYWRAKGY